MNDKPHAQLRAELAADVEAYLRRGGIIQHCAQGESAVGGRLVIYGTNRPTDKVKKRAKT